MSEAESTSAETDQTKLAVAVSRLERAFRREDQGGLPTGDRAELRRMDPLGPALPAAFWKLVSQDEVEAGVAALGCCDLERAERAFAVVIQAIAEAGVDAGARDIGMTLADSRYAEDRLVRLLRARGEQIVRPAREAAIWCASQGKTFRFGDQRGQRNGFACFVLMAFLDHSDAQSRAHAIARSFYGNLPKD